MYIVYSSKCVTVDTKVCNNKANLLHVSALFLAIFRDVFKKEKEKHNIC